MDPTHFLVCQANQNAKAHKPSAKEVESFYELHGLNFFEVLSRWRSKLSTQHPWKRVIAPRSTGFAQEAPSS